MSNPSKNKAKQLAVIAPGRMASITEHYSRKVATQM